MRRKFSRPCVALSLLVSACGSGPAHHEDSLERQASPLAVPAGCPTIEFDVNAPDPSEIALTFDDGPEYGGTTLETLDILKSEGVRATFFINTDDAIDVRATTMGRLAVQRMVAEGHAVGNHTVHHYDLSESSTDPVGEISGVVDVLRDVAPDALAVRLVRAPFGAPFFGPQASLDAIAPVIARYGVHVGWNIDSRDWECDSRVDAAACVRKNVLDGVDSGMSGIVLLHSTRPATVAALRDLIAALRARGKKFIGVEDLVVAKYGRPSRHLFRCETSADCYVTDVCGADNHCQLGPPGTGTAPIGLAADPNEQSKDGGCSHGGARAHASGALLVVACFGLLLWRSRGRRDAPRTFGSQ